MIGVDKQAHAELIFQLTECHAHGGLGTKDSVRGTADCSFFNRSDEHLQLHELHGLHPRRVDCGSGSGLAAKSRPGIAAARQRIWSVPSLDFASFCSFSLRNSRQRAYWSAFAGSGSSSSLSQKRNQSTSPCSDASRSSGFTTTCTASGR